MTLKKSKFLASLMIASAFLGSNNTVGSEIITSETKAHHTSFLDDLCEQAKIASKEEFDATFYDELSKNLDNHDYFMKHQQSLKTVADLSQSLENSKSSFKYLQDKGSLDIEKFTKVKEDLKKNSQLLKSELTKLESIRKDLPNQYNLLLKAYSGIGQDIFEAVLAGNEGPSLKDTHARMDGVTTISGAIDAQIYLMWEHRQEQQRNQKRLLSTIEKVEDNEATCKPLEDAIAAEAILMDCRLGKIALLLQLRALLLKEPLKINNIYTIGRYFSEFQQIHEIMTTYPNQGFPKSHTSKRHHHHHRKSPKMLEQTNKKTEPKDEIFNFSQAFEKAEIVKRHYLKLEVGNTDWNNLYPTTSFSDSYQGMKYAKLFVYALRINCTAAKWSDGNRSWELEESRSRTMEGTFLKMKNFLPHDTNSKLESFFLISDQKVYLDSK